MKSFQRFLGNESGATAIEYGLISAAIGAVLLAVLPSLTDGLTNTFSGISAGLQ